jgi:hypothetical protein
MKIEVENAQQNEQVDWTKNPQLVELINNNGEKLIVACMSVTTDSKDNFNGICLIDESLDDTLPIGYTSNDFSKKLFKPFHGKIILSND